MSNAARNLKLAEPSMAPVAPTTAALISPNVDALLIGGASLLVLALMSVMLRGEAPDSSLGWFVFNLSYLVNFPHFLVSYQLLYVDNRKKLFTEAPFFWAAVVVPSLLVGTLIAGFAGANTKLLGYLVTAMYFFVGWHYVKQIFGGITVSNALQKFYFSGRERLVLKANLFSLWAISFLAPNVGDRTYQQDGILYASLNLPAWTLKVAFYIVGLTAIGTVLMVIQKYIREGRLPSRTAIICFASIYAWYLPALSHPMYMHMIPFFHSLQYLLFVYAFRRNKVEAQIEKPNTADGRKQRVLNLYGYLAIPFITGALFMYIIPRFLDGYQLLDAAVFGSSPIYFAMIIFINVHHYFIDNVIWRGSNEEMRSYLFKS